jgi:hypothetical protein
MTDIADLKALLETLGKKKNPGRPKGIPKSPSSGRHKGVQNKSTLFNNELKTLSLQDVINPAKYVEMIQKLWEQAISKNSLTAARMWLDVYDNHVAHELTLTINTYEDIEEAGQKIMDAVCAGYIPITQGKELMYMLHVRKSFREGSISAAAEKIIENEANKTVVKV